MHQEKYMHDKNSAKKKIFSSESYKLQPNLEYGFFLLILYLNYYFKRTFFWNLLWA